MSQLVSELVVGYKSMAGKGVTLMERIAPEVPKEVLVDPLRVKQILSNGLTNALKHTTEGGVLLQVSCLDCMVSCTHVAPNPVTSHSQRRHSPLTAHQLTREIPEACSCACSLVNMQVDLTEMPNGQPALLMQVIDSGPGLKGADYRRLFDPTSEFGMVLPLCWDPLASNSCSRRWNVFNLLCATLCA